MGLAFCKMGDQHAVRLESKTQALTLMWSGKETEDLLQSIAVNSMN